MPAPHPANASEPLRRFLQAARGAGLPISAAEGIDAARAVDLVGFSDRAILKDALGFVLAKTADEKALYEEMFERYFRRDERSVPGEPIAEQPPAVANERATAPDIGADADRSAELTLTQMLESSDQASLAMALEAAAREVGIEKIRLLTQKNQYTRQIMVRMGLQEVEQALADLRARGMPDDDLRAQRLAARMERLWISARDHVERNLLLFARGETEQARERMLRSVRLANIDPSQHERMRVLLRRMARQMATRYSMKRRRRERGQLDIRRTLRRNMGWGGIPFVTVWKQRSIEKPRVMVLCDVSGSVAWVAQFLLMFIYALTEVMSDIRSFAYSGSLVEVSETIESNSIDEAIAQIMSSIGFGSSNYGSSFADFESGWMERVTNKTTVIILGDARGNSTDPRADIIARLAQRAKRIIWLNPEPRSVWGTGDSDIYRYAPYCSVTRVCNTLNDLERVITDLLEQGR